MGEVGSRSHPSAPVRHPAVAIYRTVFPRVSEAFIVEQVRALQKFTSVVICRDRLERPFAASHCFRIESKFEQLMFKLLGVVPSKLVRLMRASGVQLVHAHFASDGVDAVALSRQAGVPLIVTCHGSDVTRRTLSKLFSGRPSDIRQLLFWRRLIREVDVFIAISKFMAERMVQAGIPRAKIIQHYIGVDVNAIRPRSAIRNDRPFTFVCVARHEAVKGIDTLLLALAKVRHRIDVQLLQIGSGSLTRSIEAQVIALGLQSYVQLLGDLPHSKVVELIAGADCFVLSSRRCSDGSEEALGIAFLEAAAAGLPSVGTTVGGIPEAVHHGVTGLLVEPDNHVALAEAMSEIAGNSVMYSRMSVAARELACSQFNIAKQTLKLERIYDAVIRGRGQDFTSDFSAQ